MKKYMRGIAALIVLGICLSAFAGCDVLEKVLNRNANTNNTASDQGLIGQDIVVKESPDKYTWYVKNYVGKNMATVGYSSIGGDRMDHYGSGYMELILKTSTGEYLDVTDEETLKNWKVINQSPAPNTEVKLTFMMEDGEEIGFVHHMSVEQVVLQLAPVGENVTAEKMTTIKSSPDHYTFYIRDYKGLNLAQFGYISLGGEFRDEYGTASIEIVICTADGSYIDYEDKEVLKEYIVVGQNVAPNTEFKVEYMIEEDGDEGYPKHQNIEQIELQVQKR